VLESVKQVAGTTNTKAGYPEADSIQMTSVCTPRGVCIAAKTGARKGLRACISRAC